MNNDITRPVTAGLMLALAIAVILFIIFPDPMAAKIFITSDTLLPAHMAWDVTHHDYAWRNFQWPRVPSLPDLLYFYIMQILGLNWRMSLVIYTCLAALLMIWLTTLIVARIAQVGQDSAFFWSSFAFTVALLTAAVGLSHPSWEANAWYIPLMSIICISHGDAFLLSLAAYLQLHEAVRGSGKHRVASCVICAVGAFSDSLFYLYYLIPMISVVALLLARRHFAGRSGPACRDFPDLDVARVFLLQTILACGLGTLAQGLLFRQGIAGVASHDVSANIVNVMQDFSTIPWLALCFLLLLLAMGLSLYRTINLFWRSEEQELLVLCGVVAAGSSLAILGFLYINTMSYRYALPFLWWPVLLAVGLFFPASRVRSQLASLALTTAVALALPIGAPRLLSWTSPVAACVKANTLPLHLEAGLASFWLSRSAMASSDWTIQIDQINQDGKIRIWGNDVEAYHRNMRDASLPAPYNFIIVNAEIDRLKLINNFGKPDFIAHCSDFNIWKYDHILKVST